MESIIIKEDIIPHREDVLMLYNDVQWSVYTDKPEKLMNALEQSLKVWTVWDGDQLIGLARDVGDGYSIIYIQDILVLNDYQGRGIGSRLIQLILEEYQDVRQVMLLTDDTDKTIAFYKKNGLIPVSEIEAVAFMKPIQ